MIGKALICNSRSQGRFQMFSQNEVKNTEVGVEKFLKTETLCICEQLHLRVLHTRRLTELCLPERDTFGSTRRNNGLDGTFLNHILWLAADTVLNHRTGKQIICSNVTFLKNILLLSKVTQLAFSTEVSLE